MTKTFKTIAMYLVRDIFHLKFGHYRDAKALLDDANQKQLFPEAQRMHVLTDFTGDSYRLILEERYSSLAEYEQSLNSSMAEEAWREWYNQFKEHVNKSYREILKEII